MVLKTNDKNLLNCFIKWTYITEAMIGMIVDLRKMTQTRGKGELY